MTGHKKKPFLHFSFFKDRMNFLILHMQQIVPKITTIGTKLNAQAYISNQEITETIWTFVQTDKSLKIF